MVKSRPAPTVYLIHEPRLEPQMLDIFEQVTVPDISPSLYNMVMSGTVGSMSGNNRGFSFPDLAEDDDEAHEAPDYEKLDKLDAVDKANYVENWLQNPNLYEKENTSTEAPPAEPQKNAKPEENEG